MFSILALANMGQKVHLTVFQANQIDDPDAAGLAGPRPSPANLSNAARAADENTFFRVGRNVRGELPTFLFVPVKWPKLLEDGAFDDREHRRSVRPGRTDAKAVAPKQ